MDASLFRGYVRDYGADVAQDPERLAEAIYMHSAKMRWRRYALSTIYPSTHLLYNEQKTKNTIPVDSGITTCLMLPCRPDFLPRLEELVAAEEVARAAAIEAAERGGPPKTVMKLEEKAVKAHCAYR